MLVESDPHQTRVALLEDDRLAEVFIERHRRRGQVGNLYQGRVTRVLPGMQAAFVDIGLERDAFLYVSDVVSAGSTLEDLDLDGADTEAFPRVESLPAIGDLVRVGQEIVVQVAKDPLPNKGARVTTHVTLPGRLLVLLPTVRHFGISRRIEDENERQRLAAAVEAMIPDGLGAIVRTAGQGQAPEAFRADLARLTRLWEAICQRAQGTAGTARLHQELDVSLRLLRDLAAEEFAVIWVDGEETHGRIVAFLGETQPALAARVKRHHRGRSLFEEFQVERDIRSALKSRVELKSGGYIVIHPTEALVAIDVNTGRYVGRHDFDQTVLTTNLEAVKEAVRQIRLRDLGGIIVLDLIDMAQEEHRRQVFSVLEAEIKRDRSRTRVLAISEFGLVEITRQRSHSNLERLLTEPCPYCQAHGRISSATTICLELRRAVLSRQRSGSALVLRLHPDVAAALEGEEMPVLDELRTVLGVPIRLDVDSRLHREQFDILEL